jgi:hypothetical protein
MGLHMHQLELHPALQGLHRDCHIPRYVPMMHCRAAGQYSICVLGYGSDTPGRCEPQAGSFKVCFWAPLRACSRSWPGLQVPGSAVCVSTQPFPDKAQLNINLFCLQSYLRQVAIAALELF